MNSHSIISIFIIVIVLLVGTQLFVSHRLSTGGIAVTTMTNEAQQFAQQSEVLRHNIASASAMVAVTKRAEAMGFQVASVEYLDIPPLAYSGQR